MEQISARLVVKRGPTLHREFVLIQSETSLGRGTSNMIVLADKEVSRHHARISWDGSGYTVEDIGSTNGTFVNGQRVNGRIRLQHKDEIAFGEAVLLIFKDDSVQPSATNDAETLLDAVGPSYPREPVLDPPPTMPPFAENDGAAWEDLAPPPAAPTSWRSRLLGCGCLMVILFFLCSATLFFLDGYQQGRLLYCGPLQPFFELLLGAFGYAPNCF